ncbi:MAG: response regulator transcription factor [Lentisphaerae bacterium]|nr:response regulator transcription factor [Lentisphaerota bacterium]
MGRRFADSPPRPFILVSRISQLKRLKFEALGGGKTVSVRILLADDHRIMREGLRALLESQADLEVVGEASGGREAVELAGKTLPDIVVMDVEMPGLSGIEATEQILSGGREIKIVGLSLHADRQFVTPMLRAGASAYVLKDCAFDELIQAIRCVLAHQVFLSPTIAGVVVDDYLSTPRRKKSPGDDPRRTLTLRQREILQLLAEGVSAGAIASRLRLSVKTVEGHRQKVMDKLDLENMADLTRYALREGLTSLNDGKEP